MESLFKSGTALFGGIISWMVGGLGLAFVVLLALMVIDFITGILAGSMGEGLNSSVGKKGLAKKAYIILLISSVYLIQSLIPTLDSMGYAGDGIAIAYCIIEFLSIVENGGKLGVPIGPLKNVIAVLKPKGEKS
ncbi:Holin family protein [compost metagenome]